MQHSDQWGAPSIFLEVICRDVDPLILIFLLAAQLVHLLTIKTIPAQRARTRIVGTIGSPTEVRPTFPRVERIQFI